MQLVIVILLVLILLVLAPWMLFVFLAGALAYGTVVAAAGAIALAVGLIFVVVLLFKEKISAFRSKSSIDAQIRSGNEIYRAKEAARQAEQAQKPASTPAQELQPEPYRGRLRPCSYCQVEIAVGSLYCPSCGKQTKPLVQ
ncbi:hypothetical protein J3P77_09675 [Pseudomonas sp. R1-18]|uniref:hypothetical protein n=1 Tax=Pseudomonas sp. R1-18 TaxID=1632772 RepID=UPI003DA7E1A9